jgi:hypothetical protein
VKNKKVITSNKHRLQGKEGLKIAKEVIEIYKKS